MNSCTPMNKPIQPDGKRDRNVDKCKEEQMKLKIKSFVLKASPTTIKIERRGCSMLTRSRYRNCRIQTYIETRFSSSAKNANAVAAGGRCNQSRSRINNLLS
mmetsp:Transcript_41671/g.101196  ORF Transcript_41671/g.101196 Transcript_41671/m.101196 type:complete len:102 (-) Transcript_41671:397-702(-)